MSRDVTNALPTAGVGNDSREGAACAGGGVGVGDVQENTQGGSGNKLWVGNQHLKPLCNYIVIMPMEGIIRSFDGPYAAALCRLQGTHARQK